MINIFLDFNMFMQTRCAWAVANEDGMDDLLNGDKIDVYMDDMDRI